MNYPKISIVTPSYNQAPYISQTINSILSQNYPNLEYIIMDGGSTDGTVDIIKRNKKSLTHWESAPDQGQADAIYRGFEIATGEILGWVNSDDLLLPDSLEKVGRYFSMNPEKDWVTGGSAIIDNNSIVLLNCLKNPKGNMGHPVTFHELLFWGCTFNQPSSFWKRDAFFAVGGFDRSLRFCFDYDLYLRLAQRSPSGYIKDYLSCFRVHSTSKSSTIYDVCLFENELLWKKYGRYSKPKWYQLVKAKFYLQQNLFRLCFHNFKLMAGWRKLPIFIQS